AGGRWEVGGGRWAVGGGKNPPLLARCALPLRADESHRGKAPDRVHVPQCRFLPERLLEEVGRQLRLADFPSSHPISLGAVYRQRVDPIRQRQQLLLSFSARLLLQKSDVQHVPLGIHVREWLVF